MFGKREQAPAEQRKHDRHEVLQATYYRTDDDAKTIRECLVYDVSLGGMLIEAKEELERGATIVVVFNALGKVLQERMSILHKRRVITWRYGCRFTDMEGKPRRDAVLAQYFSSLE